MEQQLLPMADYQEELLYRMMPILVRRGAAMEIVTMVRPPKVHSEQQSSVIL
jgi:hypothetical protein